MTESSPFKTKLLGSRYHVYIDPFNQIGGTVDWGFLLRRLLKVAEWMEDNPKCDAEIRICPFSGEKPEELADTGVADFGTSQASLVDNRKINIDLEGNVTRINMYGYEDGPVNIFKLANRVEALEAWRKG